ncbi:MAG: hydrogenase maturation protease [Nitrospinae bacterium]|nr:hydrogenase maturation protease [Nitrospinota bacterium]
MNGDDYAGLLIAQRIAGLGLAGTDVAFFSGDLSSMIETWAGYDTVLICDAAISEKPAGTVRSINAKSGPLPREISFVSTHAFGLADTIELARTLGKLPPELCVYAVEAVNLGLGAPITREVEMAVERLVKQIQDGGKPDHPGEAIKLMN